MSARPTETITARRYLAARLQVPSSSNPTIKYVVVVNPTGAVTCNCLAGWNRRPCRHVRAVMS